MNTVNKAIRQFMDEHLDYYCNRYDVEFLLVEDNSICVCGTWWVDETNERNYIELALECNLNEFVKLFGITSLKQFEQITVRLLLEKYNSGQTEVCCSIDEPGNYYSLSFQIKDNELWATDNFSDSHKVQLLLQTPAEFMSYTKQYRLLPKLNKNYGYQIRH